MRVGPRGWDNTWLGLFSLTLECYQCPLWHHKGPELVNQENKVMAWSVSLSCQRNILLSGNIDKGWKLQENGPLGLYIYEIYHCFISCMYLADNPVSLCRCMFFFPSVGRFLTTQPRPVRNMAGRLSPFSLLLGPLRFTTRSTLFAEVTVERRISLLKA